MYSYKELSGKKKEEGGGGGGDKEQNILKIPINWKTSIEPNGIFTMIFPAFSFLFLFFFYILTFYSLSCSFGGSKP